MPQIIDATVVNQALDISGNGGDKLIRLRNGNLYAIAHNGSGGRFYIYKSTNDGKSWSQFATSNSASIQDANLATDGINIYAMVHFNNNNCLFYGYDDNGNALPTSLFTSYGQTALGKGSMKIIGKDVHYFYSAITSSFPNSFNIRCVKGAINADGSVTWAVVEQMTSANSPGFNFNNPSLVLNDNNRLGLLVEYTTTTNKYIGCFYYNGNSWLGSGTAVYNGLNYAQSSPSAIFVPPSVNGSPNGLYGTAWHGTDSTSGGVNYIRFSKSVDGIGAAWSTALRLVQGQNPILTANKKGHLFIEYERGGNTYFIKSTDNGDNWSSEQLKGVGVNPSTLFDPNFEVDFSVPLSIRKVASSVLFNGSWTQTGISVPTGDIGIKTDKNNLLSYNITTDGEMSEVVEKVNGVEVARKTLTSGESTIVGLSQEQWDAVRFGKYAEYFHPTNIVPILSSEWEQGTYSNTGIGNPLTPVSSATTLRLKTPLTVMPNTKYSISVSNGYKLIVMETDASGNMLVHHGNFATNYKITTNSNTVNLLFILANSGDATIVSNDISKADVKVIFKKDSTLNALTIEMGSEKWTYTFDKRLAEDADISSAVKAVKDVNEVYLPAVKQVLVDKVGGNAEYSFEEIISKAEMGKKSRIGTSVTNSSRMLTVTGLPFRPTTIEASLNNTILLIYDEEITNDARYRVGTSLFPVSQNGGSITDSSFSLYTEYANTQINWKVVG